MNMDGNGNANPTTKEMQDDEASTNSPIPNIPRIVADDGGVNSVTKKIPAADTAKEEPARRIMKSNSNNNNGNDADMLRHAKRPMVYPAAMKKEQQQMQQHQGQQQEPKKSGGLADTPSEEHQLQQKGLSSGSNNNKREEQEQEEDQPQEHNQQLKSPGVFFSTTADGDRFQQQKGSVVSSGTNKTAADQCSIMSEELNQEPGAFAATAAHQNQLRQKGLSNNNYTNIKGPACNAHPDEISNSIADFTSAKGRSSIGTSTPNSSELSRAKWMIAYPKAHLSKNTANMEFPSSAVSNPNPIVDPGSELAQAKRHIASPRGHPTNIVNAGAADMKSDTPTKNCFKSTGNEHENDTNTRAKCDRSNRDGIEAASLSVNVTTATTEEAEREAHGNSTIDPGQQIQSAAPAAPASQDTDNKQRPAKLHFLATNPAQKEGRQQYMVLTDNEIENNMNKATGQANNHDKKKQPAKLHFLDLSHPPPAGSPPGTLFDELQCHYTGEEENQEVHSIPLTPNTVTDQDDCQHEQYDNDQEFLQLQQLRQVARIMEEGMHQPGAFPDGPTGFNTDLHVALAEATASDTHVPLPAISPPSPSLASVEQQSQDIPNDDFSNESPSLGHHYSGLAVAQPVNDDNDSNPNIRNLPMAEELDPAKKKTNSIIKRPNLWIALTMGLLTAGVVAVALAVTLSRRNANSSSIVPTSAGPTMDYPTLAPTSEARHLFSLLPQYTIDAIDTEESPQSKAFKWLTEDPLLDTYPNWRIIQKFALATFFYATGGEDSWINKEHWLNHSVHECLWYSKYSAVNNDIVYYNPCEEENPSKNVSQGFLKKLWLWSNQLKGTLPPELYLLTMLNSLYIDSNKDLTGSISPLIGDLSSLEELFLFATEVSGSIPTEVGLLCNLTAMKLFSCQLSGTVPSEIGQILNLQSLAMDSNNFISSLPTELALLTKLSLLMFSDNDFEGSLPSEIGLMTDMEDLSLSSNRFTSIIPTELGLLSKLSLLSLDTNSLTGSIPTELGLLTKLWLGFYLYNNALVSTIPTELGLLTDLEDLLLFSNHLTSTIPTQIGHLTSLKRLFLNDNILSGSISSQVGLLTNLTMPTWTTPYIGLGFHDNQFEGTIPPELGQLSSLPALWLQGNQLTGEIPQEIFSLVVNGSLKTLNVSGNHLLSGNILDDVCLVGEFGFAFDCTPLLCACSCSCQELYDHHNVTMPTNNTVTGPNDRRP